MLSRGGGEGGEEVTGGKVNYDLMPENILKGGYHGVCINLRVQVLMRQSRTVPWMQQWETVYVHISRCKWHKNANVCMHDEWAFLNMCAEE